MANNQSRKVSGLLRELQLYISNLSSGFGKYVDHPLLVDISIKDEALPFAMQLIWNAWSNWKKSKTSFKDYDKATKTFRSTLLLMEFYLHQARETGNNSRADSVKSETMLAVINETISLVDEKLAKYKLYSA